MQISNCGNAELRNWFSKFLISKSRNSARLRLKVLLIHTGLQPGGKAVMSLRNRFNGFHSYSRETVETVCADAFASSIGLKPGVNEKDFRGKAILQW